MSDRLDPAVVQKLKSRRERIMEACLSEVVAKGYAKTTVADIVAGAAIARNSFYETFSSKERCFVAAVGWAVDLAVGRVEAAMEEIVGVEARVEAAVEALLVFVDEKPAFAAAVLVESPAGAPKMYESMQARFASMLGLDPPFDEMVVGAVARILYLHARGGEDSATALKSEVSRFVAGVFDSSGVAAA